MNGDACKHCGACPNHVACSCCGYCRNCGRLMVAQPVWGQYPYTVTYGSGSTPTPFIGTAYSGEMIGAGRPA